MMLINFFGFNAQVGDTGRAVTRYDVSFRCQKMAYPFR